jgi:hypothetical protein
MTPPPTDPGAGYNPASFDANFATIYGSLANQNKILARIEAKLDKYTEKTDDLDREKWMHRGMSFSGLLAACHHVTTLFK